MTEEQRERIVKLKKAKPKRTVTSIYEQLISEGVVMKHAVSLSTVQRYVAKISPRIQSDYQEDMRAFEMAYANDLWQMDSSRGPFLTIGQKKYPTYIIVLVDDASRFILGHALFLQDNAVNVQLVLKDAIKTYGIPKRILTDNGGPYRNQQLEIICATLGIGLRRAAPMHGNQKGKIERTFKSIKEGWMYNIEYTDFSIPEELNGSLAYVQDKNQRAHRSLKTTPWLRFIRDQSRIRKKEDRLIDQAFLHTAERKVGNDATIRLHTKVYETGQATIGQKVTVKYQPDLSEVLTFALRNAKIVYKELDEAVYTLF